MESLSPEIQKILKDIISKEGLGAPLITVTGQAENGEGFSGHIVFVSIIDKEQAKVLDLIIKQSDLNESVRDALPVHNMYQNEGYFYNTVWPEFGKLQLLLPKDVSKFDNIPKIFGSDIHNDRECLVLENMTKQDYKTIQKSRNFSPEEVKYVLRKYGQFHGLSFSYKAKDPNTFKDFCKSLIPLWLCQAENKVFSSLLKDTVKKSERYLRSIKDPEVLVTLKKFNENCVEFYKKSVSYSGRHAVISHGDSWSNNFMFQHDKDENIKNMKFIDFQCSSAASVVNDLSYFIYSGSDKEVLDNLYEYLEIYHKSLAETCSLFQCNEFISIQELKAEWKKYCHFGFFMSLILLVPKFANAEDMRKSDVSTFIDNFNSGKGVFDDSIRVDENIMELKYQELYNHMLAYNFL